MGLIEETQPVAPTQDALSGRRAGAAASSMGAVLSVTLVAGSLFAIAYENGSYSVESRNALAVLVWLTLLAGIALGLWQPRRLSAWSRLCCASLLGLAVVAGLSPLWASGTERALDDAARTLLYAGVLLLASLIVAHWRTRHWSTGIAIGITAVCAVALTSRFFPTSFGGDTIINTTAASAKRLSFPIGYWNGLAVLMALGVPFLLAEALAPRRALLRGLAVAPFPAYAAVVYLASSRIGGLASAIALLVFFAFVPRRLATAAVVAVAATGAAVTVVFLHHWTALVNGPFRGQGLDQGRSGALLVAGTCVLVGLAYAALVGLASPRTVPRRVERGLLVAVLAALVVTVAAAHPIARFQAFQRVPPRSLITQSNFVDSHLLSPSGNGRWQLWQTAYEEFKTEPVLGRGAGSYQAWQLQHGTLNTFVTYAHSQYLQVLGELGAVGLVLLLIVVGAGFGGSIASVRSPDTEARIRIGAPAGALAAFAVAMMFDWVWDLPAVAIVAIVSLALATASAKPDAPSEVRTGRRRLESAVAVLVAALCCGAIVFEMLPLLAQLQMDSSRSRAAKGDLRGALRSALRARDLTPWNATPYLQVALLGEQGGALPAAQAWIDSATSREPSDWSLWAVSARIKAESGRIAEARRSLARARSLNPGLEILARTAGSRGARMRR